MDYIGGPSPTMASQLGIVKKSKTIRNQTHLKECKYREVQIFLITSKLTAH